MRACYPSLMHVRRPGRWIASCSACRRAEVLRLHLGQSNLSQFQSNSHTAQATSSECYGMHAHISTCIETDKSTTFGSLFSPANPPVLNQEPSGTQRSQQRAQLVAPLWTLSRGARPEHRNPRQKLAHTQKVLSSALDHHPQPTTMHASMHYTRLKF